LNHSFVDRSFVVEQWERTHYVDAWQRQREYVEEIIQENRPPTLVFTEHHPVLTLGANFHAKNLLVPEERLAAEGIEVVSTDRGGDVTYHGPGQLVLYPLFPLAWAERDIHHWLRLLEQIAIDTAANFGVSARRFAPHTGAWIGDEKFAAIGVKVRRWVSMHGMAINCDVNLAPFSQIIPCGITGYGVTSLSLAANKTITISDAEAVVENLFRAHFAPDANLVV